MPYEITVAHLVCQLQTFDPDLPVSFAINPDWPQTHHIGRIVEISGSNGAIYIAENGKESVLPPSVRDQLAWSDV
ncbi:hypothetical protein [Streptomyces sp. GESEQ-4]|uniref:hypothetical protein n=1 Tax=Streptomyces sp. GESEQ-4 TaxID=2812655 RepID=UPI001B3227EF|nr:hypothetical protein [Streptomyces sp. GESEQ-4]